MSKFLGHVSMGWPKCVQALATTALLVEKSRKLTFGGTLIVSTPHQVRSILNQKVRRWLMDSRILKYDTILLDKDDLILTTAKAEFLIGGTSSSLLEHHCLQLIDY
jgi:hypothetical protein